MEARDVVADKYDNIACGSAEKVSLSSFKNRYGDKISSLRITDICFEDYYLLHDLVCLKTETINPDMFIMRESMKFAYLFSIYNDGLLNELYKQYPAKLIKYLYTFDNIFTVNYDSNIESAIEKTVYHIHGQFDKKGEVYNVDSFRNKLLDCPVKDLVVDKKFFYLYSNAISAHCGKYKQFFLNQHSSANNAIEKFAKGYLSDEKMRKEIDSWIHNENKLVSNMGYCVQLKAVHPELSFSEDYHNEKIR